MRKKMTSSVQCLSPPRQGDPRLWKARIAFCTWPVGPMSWGTSHCTSHRTSHCTHSYHTLSSTCQLSPNSRLSAVHLADKHHLLETTATAAAIGKRTRHEKNVAPARSCRGWCIVLATLAPPAQLQDGTPQHNKQDDKLMRHDSTYCSVCIFDGHPMWRLQGIHAVQCMLFFSMSTWAGALTDKITTHRIPAWTNPSGFQTSRQVMNIGCGFRACGANIFQDDILKFGPKALGSTMAMLYQTTCLWTRLVFHG